MATRRPPKKMGVKLSNTGWPARCAIPMASDTHPHEFPKFQEQMSKFATLRDMINWCIEKPNQGEKIDLDSEAMKALEAYIYWSNTGSVLVPGTVLDSPAARGNARSERRGGRLGKLTSPGRAATVEGRRV